MHTLEKFQLAETIKDRFTNICKYKKDLAVSKNAIDKGAGLLAEIINNYKDKFNEEDPKAALTYLIDSLGFYIMLGIDVQTSNEELMALLTEFMESVD